MALGHARIGFIGAPTYYNFAQMRLDGYKEAIVNNGLPVDPDLIQITELSDDGGELAAGDLLDRKHAPTAFLCVTDTCLLYTSPSPRDLSTSRMPSSA